MNIRAGAVIRTLAFIVLALALCGVIFELAGYSALLMFEAIVEGAFLRAGGWAQSLRWALPLFITATGVAISFRCGFFNIGAQGQFYIGAISAAFVTDLLGGASAAVVLPASFLAGMAGGALWALWPGYLRLRSGTDEVITTLMGNFIAALVLVYVTSGPLKDPSGTGQQAASPMLPALYRISDSQGISPAIIGIAAVGRAHHVGAGQPHALRHAGEPRRAQPDHGAVSGRAALDAGSFELPDLRGARRARRHHRACWAPPGASPADFCRAMALPLC